MIFTTYNETKVKELKCIIMQVFAVILFYNPVAACAVLEQKSMTQNIMQTFLQDCMDLVKQDYEIKKALIGVSALLQTDTSNLPQTIHAILPQLCQTATTLCIRSVEVAA